MNYWWNHPLSSCFSLFLFVSPFPIIAHLVNLISGGGKNE